MSGAGRQGRKSVRVSSNKVNEMSSRRGGKVDSTAGGGNEGGGGGDGVHV